MGSHIVDRTSAGAVRRSVVLGGGGVPGSAWMAGLAAELRRRGIDLASADSIVGTSAGAIVGAALITGRDLDSFADDPRPPGSSEPPTALKPELLAEVFSVKLVQSEIATRGADSVVQFSPDKSTIDVFNAFATNPDVLASWPAAFQAGIRQADDLAKQLLDAGWLSPKP